MASTVLKESVSRFYEGRAFNKEAKKCSNEDELLDYCIAKAWQDAISRERYKGKGNSEILSNAEQIKRQLKTELTANLTRVEADFDAWHKNMCANDSYGMRCGLWQKFINMAFKYMYCAHEMKGVFCKYENILHACHCPVDSVIAQKTCKRLAECDSCYGLLKSIARNGSDNWNSLSYEQYLEVQSAIKRLAEEEGLTALEYDFVHWGDET